MAQLLTQANGGPNVAFHTQATLPAPGAGEVIVRFLAAPINPLDLLVLANAYPAKPSFTHTNGEPIPGYDGVAEVEQCGPGVHSLSPGDTVIPARFGIGTWRTRAVLPAAALLRLAARPADPALAAVLRITVAPAYFLVEDMAPLRPCDWIVQNAGAGAIAQLVAQFARRRGARVLSVVRDRAAGELAAVRRALLAVGVDAVVTESEMAAAGNGGRRVTLALDSVHGASGQRLVKALAPGGTYVQLGFLGGGKEQLPLDARDLFGRQLTMKAFRGSYQLGLRSEDEQRGLFDWFVELFNSGELQAPPLGLKSVEWVAADGEGAGKDVVQAVVRAQEARLGQRKQILLFKH
ncbi:putative secondary metabolism biosynthetic enzyme [Neofusicoccum ribis]|uniref:enoyl-[acyl-carrier-protein] reductase n=1 Tax=Neofusicoccum ribis TaxID=45134 RepID=A0ABR3SBI3_9PEZI